MVELRQNEINIIIETYTKCCRNTVERGIILIGEIWEDYKEEVFGLSIY